MSGLIQFVRPEAKDAPEISELTCRVIRQINSLDYSSKEIEAACALFRPEYFKAKMAVQFFVIVKSGDRIIGQASHQVDKIHSLFVDTEFQGRGIGKSLLSKIEFEARKGSCKYLWVASSLRAQPFYQRMGYFSIGPKQTEYGNVVIMRKQLRFSILEMFFR